MYVWGRERVAVVVMMCGRERVVVVMMVCEGGSSGGDDEWEGEGSSSG